MSRWLTPVLAVAFAGCTFNVASFSRDVVSEAPSVPATLRADVSRLPHLSGWGVSIEGAPTTTRATATVTVAGVLGAGTTAEAVANGVHVDWPLAAGDATTRGLTVAYDGPMSETVWTEGVRVALPTATAIDVAAGTTSIDVSGMSGAMHVTTTSGSIDVMDAPAGFVLEADTGSIDVAGASGTATCASGSIALDLSGAVVAHTTSGSIAGDFGGGGELTAESGSIRVALHGALDRDLVLSADSGSIHLVVPIGTSMRVETHTGSGSSHVRVGDLNVGDDVTATVGAGGFLVRATTDSGSIVIDEQ